MSEAFDRHWDRAFELYEEGKFVEAISEWREAGRLGPEDGYVLNNIGKALWHSGQQEAAIAEWREAVRLEPDYGNPHGSLARALSNLGYSPEALAAVRAAIRLCPNDASLHVWLGYHLTVEASKSGNKARGREAHAAFQRAVDLDPTNSYALLHLGKLQWWIGTKQEAIKTLKAATVADPNSVEAHVALAGRQSRMGRLRDATQTVLAIFDLPDSQERRQYYEWMNRLTRRVQIALFVVMGLAASLIWRRWKQRK